MRRVLVGKGENTLKRHINFIFLSNRIDKNESKMKINFNIPISSLTPISVPLQMEQETVTGHGIIILYDIFLSIAAFFASYTYYMI